MKVVARGWLADGGSVEHGAAVHDEGVLSISVFEPVETSGKGAFGPLFLTVLLGHIYPDLDVSRTIGLAGMKQESLVRAHH